MSDQEWDVLEFVERFRNGEFDGQLGETLESLSQEQIEDLQGLLLMQGESRCEFHSGLHLVGKR
jgi:hypothetical protein